MKKTSVYIISITAALALTLCACGARTGNAVDDVKDDIVDTTDQVVDDVTDTTRDAVDDMTGSDGVVRDKDGIIDDDDTGHVNQNGAGTVNGTGDGMLGDVPGMTETDDSINAGSNGLDTETDNSIGASTTTDVPAAQ